MDGLTSIFAHMTRRTPMSDALYCTLRDTLDRLKSSAVAFHASIVGTTVENSPLFHLAEEALAEMRAAPRGTTALVLVTALQHLLVDAAEHGLGDTPEHAACDIAVEEAQAAFAFARAAIARRARG